MAEKTNIDDMIRTLADSPEDMRKKMILERFKMIAAQPEEQRVQSVKAILLAVSKLDLKKKKDFIRTRTNALMESPPEVRKKIQIARVRVGAQVPDEVNQSDMMAIMEVCLEWPKEKHQKLLDSLAGVFKELNMEMPDIQGMIQKIQEVRKEMKKPWWKFW